MTIESLIYGPDGAVEGNGGEGGGGAGHHTLVGASSGTTTKTITVLGFNVTGTTADIDGTTYKVVEAYIALNFDPTGYDLYWKIGNSIVALITGNERAKQASQENVSPFTDYNGTVYDRAYKFVLYAPATWGEAFFQAIAAPHGEVTNVDSYERDGISYARRGAMGKDAFVMVGYDSSNTAFSSMSQAATVSSGRLSARVLLGSATDVTVEEEEEPIHTVDDKARFMSDVQFKANAYIGEKIDDNKVVKQSELAAATENLVEQEQGKGLSTNDYSNEEKEKVVSLMQRGYLMRDENGVYAVFPD